DMSEVDFISSAGVGLFLGTVSQLRTTGGDLIFTGMLPAILEVFEIINLSAYFRIVPSLEALEPAPRG
ncbi:MAG: STAS domain-containing protein, partial [Candidatus Krumholzibacteria bacterium]|nr:STAS domain-containing protein [Candidatus Krumholzibacteria bacterium]